MTAPSAPSAPSEGVLVARQTSLAELAAASFTCRTADAVAEVHALAAHALTSLADLDADQVDAVLSADEPDEPTRALIDSLDDLDRSFVMATHCIYRSILDNVARMESLAESERWMREGQELAKMGSYDWHIPTDTNRWSDELYRIYGAEPQSFNPSYERFLSYIHPDDRDTVQAVHQEAYRTLEPYSMVERIVRSDGETRYLATTGEVIAGPDGTPERMRGICIDITERVQAEELASRLDKAELSRRHALELNDNVVQGLAATVYALGGGAPDGIDHARELVAETLSAARSMMSGLLDEAIEASEGSLIRDEPARTLVSGRNHGDAETGSSIEGDLSVVVADDSEDMRYLMRLNLDRIDGMAVVAEARDGVQAINAVAEHRPHVILLDLAMPVLDGLSAIPRIRDASPETKIVILTGFETDRMGEACHDRGAHAYVEKGADLDEIAAVIRNAVGARSAN